MKYKVGDKVRVIPDLNTGVIYPYIRNGTDHLTMDVNSDMARLAGQMVTIDSVQTRGVYYIRECDGTSWVESMFVDEKKIIVNVGDKLRVLSDLSSCSDYYYINLQDDEEDEERLDVYDEMEEYAGEWATVEYVDDDGTFKIDLDSKSNWWCLSMFDLSRKEEDEKVTKGKFTFNTNGCLLGSVVAHMSRVERVKVIPFIKYDETYIYWKHSRDGSQVKRCCSSYIKDVINKKLQYYKLYDDGDVKVYYKDSSGNNESMYIPECCLMPFDMKVAELLRPEDEYMAKAYDAYIKKYEPEMIKEPADTITAVDLQAGDYVKIKDEIKPNTTYYYKNEFFTVNKRTIERLKNRVLLVNNVVKETKEANNYIVVAVPDADGLWKVDDSLVVFYECRCTLFEKTEEPAPTVVLTAELVAKLSTNMTKKQLSDIYASCGGTILSSYTKADVIELIKENFKNQNKNIMSDESEEIKMSKLGLGGMLTRMFGEVGEVTDGSLALTFAGAVAVRRKDGDYVRYDADGENIENQGSFILEGSDKFMILMPSPTVAVGDIIKHKGKFLQVLEVKANGSLSTVNHESGTKTTVLKETNLFGMQFYTKVMSMMTGMNGTDGTTPGGFNPLMMLILNKDEEGSESKMDMTTIMMLSGMFGGQGATGQMNPMIMLALLGDKEGGEGSGIKDMMMMSMFMGGNSPFVNMFGGQTTPAQIAEPLKPVGVEAPGLAELCKSQAVAIEQLNKTVAGLNEQLAAKTTAETKAVAKKATDK